MEFVGPTSWSTGTKSAVQESSHLLTYNHPDLVTYIHTDPVTYILTDRLQESSNLLTYNYPDLVTYIHTDPVTYIVTDRLQESSNLSYLEKSSVPVEMSQITDLGSKKFCSPI